ncbi:cTAGE family member 5 [Anarhichas minor]|uniref:cTAGE family member 5 n=1 Tax=Anarhichas minor TaxID=65739 RepID=UPI003F7415A3
MSRVQATRDHHGEDCRFLSFRRGDTIFVYHKLTGKREDLWAGSIDKQFGYFPKEAAQEELVYAAMEKVVETQKSDFFCMDEFGYPIDSSHLDGDADDDQKNQESETTQTSPYPDDTSAESPSTSEDPSAVSAQEADGTSAEEDENKSAGDGGAGTLEGARETPAALREQGGSAPSSSWLGSSVTGWLGLAKEEEAGSLAEAGKKDEGTERQAEASVASSVTGWLGLGGEGKPDDAVKSREEDTENADSFTSAMTGWLGFGVETKTAEKERDEERDDDEEPAERFRSRRMSLDLEGSQLHEEEKKEKGTLDWLGSGLSSTLGFGLTNQESGHETTPEREAEETIQEEEEQPASGSWFDVGIGDILGFRKDKREVDESAGSGFKETEEDKTLEHPTGSENVNTGQSQRAPTEVGTETGNESEMEEVPKDQNVPPEIRVNNNDIGTSDSSKDRVSPEDAASEVDLEDISTQTELEKTSHTEGGMSSMLNSSKEEEEDNVSDDRKKEKSAEMEGEDHQISKSIESEAEVNNREAGRDKSDTASGNDQDFFTQSGINFGTVDLNLNSVGQSVGEVEEDKTEDAVEEGAGIPNQTDNTQESTDAVRISASSHEGEGNDAETDVLHPDISTTRTDDSAEQSQGGGESQPLLSSGTAEERNEPVSNEDEPLPSHSVETNDDSSDSLAMIDSTETETLQGEIGQEGEAGEGSSQEFGSSRSTNKSTDSTYESASEEDRRTLSTNESATEIENTADQDSVSPHMQQRSTQSVGDAHELKETVKETERDSDKNNLQPVQTETIELEKYILNESGLKSAIGSGTETQTEEVGESKENEMQWEVEELKGEETQQEVKEIKEEEKKQEMKEIKEDEKQKEGQKIKKGDKQEGMEGLKEKQGEKEHSNGKEKKEEMEKIKEENKQEELKGVEKQDEVKELKEEGKQQGIEELKEEKQEEVEELKEAEEREELKEVEGVKKQEGEEKQAQSNFEEEMENSLHSLPHAKKDTDSPEPESDRKETQDENSSESVFSKPSTQTEKSRTENPQMEEEEREEEKVRGEMKEEVEEMENVERLRRNKEEDVTLKCSNELCSEASEDRFVRDRDGNDPANMLSSLEEGAMETGQQNPVADNEQILADRTGASQPVPVEGLEKDEDGIQVEEEKEEKRDDGTMADEGKNNCLPHSGESTNPLSLGQTTENTEDDQLHSSEAHNTELGDSETISKGVSPEKETEQVHSDHKIVTEEHTDREEREMNAKHDDFRTDGGMEVPVLSVDPVESPAVLSAPSDGHDIGTGEPGSGGSFGLFKSAFSFFKSPITETEGSKESAPSLGSDTGETSKVQTSPPPVKELDSTTDSSQVNVKDLHSDSPITLSRQPSPPVAETQTSPPSPTQTRSHPAESPLQTKTLTQHHKSLLAHMSADELTVLTELFGRHKLQFLDYVLGSVGTTTDDPDGDDSILLDIERLLGYHKEALVAPSVRLADAPREDKEKTRTLIALQKLETLLARVRETFSTAGASCVGESCSTQSGDKETPAEEDSSVGLDSNTPRDEWVGLDKEKDGRLSGGTAKERVTKDEERGEEGKTSEGERVPPESRPHIQSASPQPLEGVMRPILDFAHQIAEDSTTHVHAARELLIWLTVQVVSSLPDDIRPGPDLYGVPWEPVIVSGVVGLVTMLLFTCRCYSSVKSRMYRSKERRMAEQVAELLDEKCKVLETLSKCQQESDDLESTLRDSGVLAQTQRTEHLEVKARQLGHAKRELDRDLEQLKDQLDQQREQRIEQERRIALLEESMKTTEEETRDLQSQDEQAHTTLKVYSMNSDRLQRNLETAGEENALLQESNAQLRQQVEGWAERVSELEAEMSRCEVAHSTMLQDVANKDERLTSLTDRLLRMKAWDSDLEEEEGGEKETSNGRAEANGKGEVLDTQGHLQKVQKLIYAAKLNADLKAVDEDKDRLFAKLNDEVKAKEDLQVSIKELVNEKSSLQSDSGQYQDQVQRLQQKLHIMTEMYQENELKLHRLLTVEEKERMQKQEKLSKADRNIALAMEELSNYRQRAGEMEEELEKTKQSYQTQISAHEKKAHNNWLAARAADRELTDIRRENGLFRQKLTDTQFKLEALDLDSLARPLPFRAERSPYGPSPLGRPASETRAFLSPPTLMDGPPGRLSPRVSRGPVEPPGGQGELEQSGGPHSDSGSISPTWERDRRGPPLGPPGPAGPLGPPGYMFPEPGGPMYRRPPLGALGPLHPRGLPPGLPHPADMADGPYRENSHGPGELEHRESGPGDRRTPPEADPRIGGAPPMGPMGGPFPRRAPYGPPPPDFYSSRGPVGPPMMPMWAPPGMMLPPRFPPGGPLAPRPHYAPPMRPPLLDGLPHPSMGPLPPQQSVPSPPHSQSPEEPSPEDAI